jgi:hypothetical protein
VGDDGDERRDSRRKQSSLCSSKLPVRQLQGEEVSPVKLRSMVEHDGFSLTLAPCEAFSAGPRVLGLFAKICAGVPCTAW